ncbi:unnamed protein product, partial [Mesorhabditis belari]|uniref:Phosphatidylinositol 4-kinase beta n=1 Tax=Mesorhabditis belari TaxID=2138241 RepID=A0AAF3FI39_9BILA
MSQTGEVLRDCEHSADGVCSRCVLRRSFQLGAWKSSCSSPSPPPILSSISSIHPIGSPEDEERTPVVQPALPFPYPTSSDLEEPMSKISLIGYESMSVESRRLSYSKSNDLNGIGMIESTKKVSTIVSPTNHPVDTLSPEITPSGSAWLRRLFDSPLCNTSFCLHYLSKRPTDVSTLKFLGEKLSSFPVKEVDFYIPQLINLYINNGDVAEAINAYIMKRCEESGQVALLCCWLLEAFGGEQLKYEEKRHGEKLRQWILSILHRAKDPKTLSHSRSLSTSLLSPDSLVLSLKRSETTMGPFRQSILTRAFDDGCDCFEIDPTREFCICENLSMRGEKEFINSMIRIGNTLKDLTTKEEKSRRLISELVVINNNLPARVWLPLYWDQHIVLRIPPTSGCVLNSKDKAPYCIYVEVLLCESVRKMKVPTRMSDAEAELYQKLARNHSTGNLDSMISTPPTVRPPIDDKVISCEMASDTLSQKSMDMDSCNSEERISAAEISNRLKRLMKKPKRQMRHTAEDPSAFAMSEPWEEKRERLRIASPYGRLTGWELLPVIVKSGDDLRQEMLAYQLLQTLKVIWEEEKVPVWIRPYKICVLSQDAGLIEPIVDACSLHQIKRNQQMSNTEEGKLQPPSLKQHFLEHFGKEDSDNFIKAQQKFVESCAAYSLACYFLQVKDRHNGNILIDSDGHLIHIDFGFILSASPKNLGFESSPFKLTSEYTEVMGGLSSSMYHYYRALMLQGLIAARKHHERIMNIAEIMAQSGSPLPCFRAGEATIVAMRQRFHMGSTEKQLQAEVDKMIEQSRDALTTRLYDSFQYWSNSIF